MSTHLHFAIGRRDITDRVLIPKFYDPDLEKAANSARTKFELVTLRDVFVSGKAGSQLGVWLPRETYGSGEIPYVRTSDLFHWRVRPDFKMGVSPHVYAAYSRRSDVREGDILLVAHGTYLIGEAAIVGEDELPVLIQDHVYRLRVRPDSGVHPFLLLAALATNFVKRQVRARQFSAEIIDKIGDRHLTIRLPIIRDRAARDRVIELVARVMRLHADVRIAIRSTATGARAPGPRAVSRFGFSQRRAQLSNRVLIPRYYDPELEAEVRAAELADGVSWTSLGQLVDNGMLRVSTGVEVGKMSYGTGRIPFVRTSDLVDWELVRDPTQGVSRDIYTRYSPKGILAEDDVLLVRDGTYLVGSSAMVVKEDLPALFCGGMFRLRATRSSRLSPHALLGVLNLPLVRRQMRCKQFTRDVIDTLGPRLLEVRVPSPDSETARAMEQRVAAVITMKSEIKRLMSEAIAVLEPAVPPSAEGRPGWSMR